MIGWHLGARVSELVDDHLVGAERRRALDHLASCRSCQEEVEQERRARRVASSLRCVGMPAGLTDRILAVSAGTAAAGTAAQGTGAAGAAPWADGARHPGITPRLALVGAAAVGVAGLAAVGTLYALGTPTGRGPEVLAQVAPAPTLVVGNAGLADAGDDEASSPASWPRGFVAPTALPTAASIAQAQVLEPGVVLVELSLDGTPVTVVEAHGRLELPEGVFDATALAGHVAHEVDGWWVTQLGDDVVAVRGDAGAVAELLAAFDEPTPEWSARFEAGWRVVTGD